MDTHSQDYRDAAPDGTREGGRHHGRHTGHDSGFERLTERLLEYLRTRTSEHWVMFLGGLVIGSLLG